MSFVLSRGKQVIAVILSVLLSTLVVALIANGVTYIDTDSVGVATSAPGGALGVKGAAFVEDFLSLSNLQATSSVGIGTNTPAVALGVDGQAFISGLLIANSIEATSTATNIFEGDLDVREQATSSFTGGLNIATSTVIIDQVTGRMAIGTSTFSDADVAGTQAVDPALTIEGAGSADTATGTLYLAGGGGNGGQLILKSSNGLNCISIMANSAANAPDASGLGANDLLTFKVVECPR